MALDCLDTLVGLSKTEYACFTDETPDGFDTSDSGYHLTDTDYGLTVVDQCALAGWTLLQSALEQAVLELKTDLRARLRQRFDSRISPFRGHVCKLKQTGALAGIDDDYIGVRIRVYKQIKGAKFVFKKIYLGLNASGDFDVTITSNDPLFVAPDALTISAVANEFANAATTVELPLCSYSCADDYLEYYIAYSRSTAQPLNNKISCCGDKPTWMGYFETKGMRSSDNIATDGTFNSNANGLVLDGFLACEELDWICELEELNGYYVLDVLARSIQMRGSAIGISALVDTLDVSPCTGYQLEALNARRAYLNQRYSDNIAWIVDNMPTGVTECFTCKPTAKFHKFKMLV